MQSGHPRIIFQNLLYRYKFVNEEYNYLIILL